MAKQNVIQNLLNEQGKLFEPRKTERICYNQPRKINGKDTYIQPSPCEKTTVQRG